MSKRVQSFDINITDSKYKTWRVVLDINGVLRPILWINFGKDGSIYTSICGAKNSEISTGTGQWQNGIAYVNYSDGDVVTCNNRSSKKISFHKSGIIHGFKEDSDVFNLPFDSISKKLYLCDIIFSNIMMFNKVNSRRKRDLVIKYNYRYENTLSAIMFISKEDVCSAPLMDGANSQVNIVFNYYDVKEIGMLRTQIVFYDSKNIWPPSSYIIYPHKRNFN